MTDVDMSGIQFELTEEETILCDQLAERSQLMLQLRNAEYAKKLQSCATTTDVYWAGSASASIGYDVTIGRVRNIEI